MTYDDLIEYRDLIYGTCNGKSIIPISVFKNESKKTLLVGCTANNQMIHIYIHTTDYGNNYFSTHIHGNSVGGFQNCTHIHTTLTPSDIQGYKIKYAFVDFTDSLFLKSLYTRLSHYTPSMIDYIEWFDKCCDHNGYPSQIALYISEDILNSRSSGDDYSATICHPPQN